MELNEILKEAVAAGASDVHMKHGLSPIIRVRGKLRPMDADRYKAITHEQLLEWSRDVMDERQRTRFEKYNEIDLGYSVFGLGRFRMNVFQQRGTLAMSIRPIPYSIRSMKDLELPSIIEKIGQVPRGLVLVTGATGSGKSTTIASLLEYINIHRQEHIITIEDPIEFLIRDKNCIVNQRELGFDTYSFSYAMRSALRQDPDIIFVGEMRDLETIETALIASETGHLVFSTLHTNDAQETINRIISVFPHHQQSQIRIQLAAVLQGVISQRLVPRLDKEGVIPAVEVLIANQRVREHILDEKKTPMMHEVIETSFASYKMQSFDQSLIQLIREGKVSYEDALSNTTNADDFALRYHGVSSMDGGKWDEFDKFTPYDAADEKVDEVDLAAHQKVKIDDND